MSDIQTWLDQVSARLEAVKKEPAQEDRDHEADSAAWSELYQHAPTDLTKALNALQAVLDMHQPINIYEPAGEWDCEGKYIPHCKHGDDWEHPDHKMIDGWWQCATTPEMICSEEMDGDPWPYPCATIEAIQDAIGEPQ